jgi:hypothetical protein
MEKYDIIHLVEVDNREMNHCQESIKIRLSSELSEIRTRTEKNIFCKRDLEAVKKGLTQFVKCAKLSLCFYFGHK